MKKRFILVLTIFVVFFLISCGKKESGVLTIKNNSSYDIKVVVGQDYSSDEFDITSGDTKKVDWKQYCLCYIDSPENIVEPTTMTNSLFVIENIKAPITYTVKNGVADLQFNDDNQHLLLSSTNLYKDNLSIPKGTTKIKTTKPLNNKNIIIKSETLTIDGVDYKTFEKLGTQYYQNKNVSNKLQTQKIHIAIDNDKHVILISY